MREIVKREAIASSIAFLVFRGRCGGRVAGDGAMRHTGSFYSRTKPAVARLQVSTALSLRIGLRARYSQFYDWLTYRRVRRTWAQSSPRSTTAHLRVSLASYCVDWRFGGRACKTAAE